MVNVRTYIDPVVMVEVSISKLNAICLTNLKVSWNLVGKVEPKTPKFKEKNDMLALDDIREYIFYIIYVDMYNMYN